MKHILTPFVLLYLRLCAQLALKLHKPIIIGVAGSVGKSSTRNALYALLKDHFPTKMVYGNSETGVPLGILGIYLTGFSSLHWLIIMLKAPQGLFYLRHTKYLIVEMGIDEPFPPKNMAYLLTIVKPSIAISLNVSATHTMQFEKVIKKNQTFSSDKEKREFLIEKIAEEDTRIITDSGCQLGIYNTDAHHIVNALNSFLVKDTKTILHTFGQEKTNTIYYDEYAVSPTGSHFSFATADTKDSLSLFFPRLMLPKEYQELFAAVILVGKYLGLSHEQITKSLETNFNLPHGRASLFQGINHSLIIDSSYNASKDAVIAFLSLVETVKKATKRPVVFLFGDMRELGEEGRIEHEEVARALLPIVDYLYCVGPLTKQYVISFVKKQENQPLKDLQWFASALDAGKYLKESLAQEALVLVKGSQNTIFLEEAIKYLLLDKKDTPHLCRQEKYWKEIKQKYFTR